VGPLPAGPHQGKRTDERRDENMPGIEWSVKVALAGTGAEGNEHQGVNDGGPSAESTRGLIRILRTEGSQKKGVWRQQERLQFSARREKSTPSN